MGKLGLEFHFASLSLDVSKPAAMKHIIKQKSCSKRSTKECKPPWNLQRPKMGERRVENVNSLAFLSRDTWQ